MLSVRERFGCLCCRETIRAALHRRTLSWTKAKKLLGRADPEQRQAFVEQLQGVLDGAQHDRLSSDTQIYEIRRHRLLRRHGRRLI
jgi:hypothetical protein